MKGYVFFYLGNAIHNVSSSKVIVCREYLIMYWESLLEWST